MSNFVKTTSKIQEIKKNFTTTLWAMAKYLKQEDTFINEDFFWKDKKEINETDIKEVLEKIEKKLDEIKKLKWDLKELELSEVEKKFILNSLNTAWLKFIMFKSSIYLEAEKAWYKLSIEDRHKYLNTVNKLQNIFYWPEISENTEESGEILYSLQDLLDKNTTKVSTEEAKTFQNFIDSFDIPKIKLKENKDNLKDRFISKETFEKIFNMLLDLYDLDWWKLSIENVDNFSVKKDEKLIRCPESKLETTPLKRIFQLIDHEIWTHAIRGYNTNKTTQTTWEWYLEWEEWFATMSELLFDNTIDEISVSPTIHHITTFIAENRNWDETKEIFEIYFKLTWLSEEKAKIEALDRMLRVKRFVSLNEIWANRKDVSYTRWQKQIVDFFQKANEETRKEFLKDFYYSKLSLEDVSLVKEFRESLRVDESELRYPLWIWKILYKKLSDEKIFLSSMQEGDFRFANIEKLEFSTKRKIINILNLIK